MGAQAAGGGQAQQVGQPSIFETAAQGMQQAARRTGREAQFQPGMVKQDWQAPTLQAGQLRKTNLQPYMNPYEQAVVDQSLADLERQRQMQINELGAQATAAGAFGGSRQGVAEALTNEAFARQGGQLAAGLRQQGYTQAQSAAQQDIANRLAAAQSNQAARLQQQQLRQSSQVQNQAARLAASQQRLAAAGQQAAIGQQGFNLGQTIQQDLARQGAQEQALNQALIDATKAQYGQYTAYPSSSLGLLTQALGATPTPQTQTTSSSPGLFDYLTLATTAAGAFR